VRVPAAEPGRWFSSWTAAGPGRRAKGLRMGIVAWDYYTESVKGTMDGEKVFSKVRGTQGGLCIKRTKEPDGGKKGSGSKMRRVGTKSEPGQHPHHANEPALNGLGRSDLVSIPQREGGTERLWLVLYASHLPVGSFTGPPSKSFFQRHRPPSGEHLCAKMAGRQAWPARQFGSLGQGIGGMRRTLASSPPPLACHVRPALNMTRGFGEDEAKLLTWEIQMEISAASLGPRP
jgi:hypothetical protein